MLTVCVCVCVCGCVCCARIFFFLFFYSYIFYCSSDIVVSIFDEPRGNKRDTYINGQKRENIFSHYICVMLSFDLTSCFDNEEKFFFGKASKRCLQKL